MPHKIPFLTLLLLALAPPADADILHVAETGDGTDGSSWEKAFTSISVALHQSATGDEVWVKGGRYNEALDLKSGVGIFGGFAGTEGDEAFGQRKRRANETVIDASGFERSSVIAENVSATVLDGLVIIGGYEVDPGYGGGVDIQCSSLCIANCCVTENVAEDVGGIRIENSSISITSTSIIRNRSSLGRFRIAGGIECINSHLFMDDCVVSDHESSTAGGLEIANSRPGYSAVVEDSTVTNNVGSRAGGVWGWSNVTLSRCYIADNTCEDSLGLGGGIRIRHNCLVEDCTIAHNNAIQGAGGGIGIDVLAKNCRIINCLVSGNRAGNRAGSFCEGGGVHDFGRDTYIEYCRIVDNFASGWGGGLYSSGGIVLNTCHISCNHADKNGGGFYLGSGVVRNCTVSNNSCRGFGGATATIGRSTETDFINCVFSGNQAGDGGGALYIRDVFDDPSFVNCTFVNNSAPLGTAIYNEEGMGSFVNCVFVNGGTDELREVSGASMSVRYSNVQGGWPGEGNIDGDPVFVDRDNEDFRLQVFSACIDAASISGATTDLDGRLRPVDIPGIGRDGEGAFDMGAYEYPLEGYPTPTPSATPAPQPTLVNPNSDINLDGVINAEDLLILLRDWQKVTGT